MEKKRRTGEVADGDGDAGDGDETEVVESAEVSDDFGEGRVPINHRVLWLRRRCDVCVHFCNAGGCCSEPGFHSKPFFSNFASALWHYQTSPTRKVPLSIYLLGWAPVSQILGPMQPGL